MRNPIPTEHNRIALAAVAGMLGVMFVGAILPTPLYPLYREAFGFSAVTLTLIYATYVLGNLAALLFFGPLSWILVGAELARSLAVLVFAAALGGLAGGLGYSGSLEVINRIAPADRRSEVVSSYMIAIFAGNSVPVIGVGFLSVATTSLTAHVIFAAVLTVLTAIALWTGLKFAPKDR